MGFVTNSYTLTNRCPDGGITTDCVQYVGPDIPCLGIQSGCVLTQIECQIATNLCNLIGATNVSTVVIPSCFITAWGSTDPTILNLFNFILEQACLQQTILNNVISGVTTLQNLDPIITITYPPCCNSTCNPGTTLTVSKHLENILICLCNIQNLLGTLPTGYSSFGCALATLGNDIAAMSSIINLQTTNTQAIYNAVQASGTNIPGYTIPSQVNPSFNC